MDKRVLERGGNRLCVLLRNAAVGYNECLVIVYMNILADFFYRTSLEHDIVIGIFHFYGNNHSVTSKLNVYVGIERADEFQPVTAV